MLLFQTRNVNAPHNIVRLNNRVVGHLRPAVQSWEDKRSWSANVKLVHTDELHEGENELEFQALDEQGKPWPEGDIDDFLISDVTILYPTAGEGEGTRPAVEDAGAVRAELAELAQRIQRLEGTIRR